MTTIQRSDKLNLVPPKMPDFRPGNKLSLSSLEEGINVCLEKMTQMIALNGEVTAYDDDADVVLLQPLGTSVDLQTHYTVPRNAVGVVLDITCAGTFYIQRQPRVNRQGTTETMGAGQRYYVINSSKQVELTLNLGTVLVYSTDAEATVKLVCWRVRASEGATE